MWVVFWGRVRLGWVGWAWVESHWRACIVLFDPEVLATAAQSSAAGGLLHTCQSVRIRTSWGFRHFYGAARPEQLQMEPSYRRAVSVVSSNCIEIVSSF